ISSSLTEKANIMNKHNQSKRIFKSEGQGEGRGRGPALTTRRIDTTPTPSAMNNPKLKKLLTQINRENYKSKTREELS
ncbi:hypothetical protein ACXWOZ_09685, partial [Streptococcus pyogenes]